MTYKAVKQTAAGLQYVRDDLSVEEALQININGKPYTVTMRTPGDDPDLIRGLFYTEDIYRGSEALVHKIVEENEDGIPTSVNTWLNPVRMGDGYDRSRSLISVASCGICGKRELEDLKLNGKPLQIQWRFGAELLPSMFRQMLSAQSTFNKTGGSHAAACFSREGKLLTIREDIGRHNAVDKAIGHLVNISQLDLACCLVVSGRLSFEIVSKTFKAGIPILAAVSAPSSLAVDCAEAMGVTLFGYCRDENFTCYTHSSRIEELNEFERLVEQ